MDFPIDPPCTSGMMDGPGVPPAPGPECDPGPSDPRGPCGHGAARYQAPRPSYAKFRVPHIFGLEMIETYRNMT